MTNLFKIDKKLTEILSQQSFTVSAEVIPPRNGSPQNEIFEQIQKVVQSGAQFLSVTKGAGGSLRGGSLPIAQAVKDHFSRPAIAHFTCRDLSPEEVENQLMDHHFFGIRNILALRGDPPQGQPNWKPKAESYPYAYQLIEQISKLNKGGFLQREDSLINSPTPVEKTDFCLGCAAYPDAPEALERVGYFANKVKAGAEYGITQMLYDVDHYKRFLDECAELQVLVPILPGLRILKNQSQAEKMRTRFKISIPDKIMNALPTEQNSEKALEVFLRLVEDFKSAGAPGIHLFVLSDTELACQGLRALLI